MKGNTFLPVRLKRINGRLDIKNTHDGERRRESLRRSIYSNISRDAICSSRVCEKHHPEPNCQGNCAMQDSFAVRCISPSIGWYRMKGLKHLGKQSDLSVRGSKCPAPRAQFVQLQVAKPDQSTQIKRPELQFCMPLKVPFHGHSAQ